MTCAAFAGGTHGAIADMAHTYASRIAPPEATR
jgi:hypothetical protein